MCTKRILEFFGDPYGGNPEGCRRTYVSFGIAGDGVDPDIVTRDIGIEPTRAFRKGEEYVSRGGGILSRPIGVWRFSSEREVNSTSTEEHAKHILDKLEPRVGAIAQYMRSPEIRTVIAVWFEARDGHGGYTLKASTLSRLCRLCNDIDFYYIGE
jgi:hypothetical protein